MYVQTIAMAIEAAVIVIHFASHSIWWDTAGLYIVFLNQREQSGYIGIIFLLLKFMGFLLRKDPWCMKILNSMLYLYSVLFVWRSRGFPIKENICVVCKTALQGKDTKYHTESLSDLDVLNRAEHSGCVVSLLLFFMPWHKSVHYNGSISPVYCQ